MAHASTTEDMANYQRYELENLVGFKRMSRRILLHTVSKHPKLIAGAIRRKLPQDTTYIGAGSSMIAYKVGDEVVKVHKKSMTMTETHRRSLAAKEQSTYDLMCLYLGSAVLPQTIDTSAHPIHARGRAVHIRQPYVSFTDLNDVFPAAETAINRAALDVILCRFPTVRHDLYTFASSGLAMARDTSLVPDITGYCNLGIHSDADEHRLVLVDAQPLDATVGWAKSNIVPQLEDMRQYLSICPVNV